MQALLIELIGSRLNVTFANGTISSFTIGLDYAVFDADKLCVAHSLSAFFAGHGNAQIVYLGAN